MKIYGWISTDTEQNCKIQIREVDPGDFFYTKQGQIHKELEGSMNWFAHYTLARDALNRELQKQIDWRRRCCVKLRGESKKERLAKHALEATQEGELKRNSPGVHGQGR